MGSPSTFHYCQSGPTYDCADPSSTFSEYGWPDHDSLSNAQLAADDPMPQECTVGSEGLARYRSQAVWIPEGDKTLLTTTADSSSQRERWSSRNRDDGASNERICALDKHAQGLGFARELLHPLLEYVNWRNCT
jgi:hypothetical protein